MTDGNREIVHEGFVTGIRDSALHEGAGDRVRAVEDDHLDASLGGGFEKVSQGGFVGIKAGADILNIEHHRVESLRISAGGLRAASVLP